MTREELLEKIDRELSWMDAESWHNGARALRAIVELHQPIYTFVDGSDKSVPLCIQCRDGDFIADYPCQTIQLIDKELQYD